MSAAGETFVRKPESVAANCPCLGKLLPELSVVATLAWFLFGPEHLLKPSSDGLMFAAMADGATLMLSATLVDVASRLKRMLPWWLLLLIAVGILLMYPDTFAMLTMGWAMGFWIFLPFAWSLIERLRELWTLPSASPIEKIRRRTLTFDRLYTGLIIGGVCVAGMIINALLNEGSMELGLTERVLPWLMLAFYSVAAFNAWRVHRPGFSKRPRSLWPWIDQDQATYLDPI
jgi:hypothetical protein